MDITVIQQLITSLGFPVVCVIGLGLFIREVWKNNREDTQKQMEQITSDAKAREDILYKQIEKFSTSLDKFNETLVRIDTRLEALEKRT